MIKAEWLPCRYSTEQMNTSAESAPPMTPAFHLPHESAHAFIGALKMWLVWLVKYFEVAVPLSFLNASS